MSFLNKLRICLFGITITKDKGYPLEHWMIETLVFNTMEYEPIVISDSGVGLLYYKHGLRQIEEYKIKIMFFNFLFFKNKLNFRRFVNTYKEGVFVVYQTKNKKKHKTIWLCEKDLKEKIGFVPTKMFYKIEVNT